MGYSFTKDQSLAIKTRDRTLLVSAAAGSGKTATLTERIISHLVDSEHPASLSRLVIATFTNDSAADMRKKIARALTEALARDPENEWLLKQELLLPSAEISTISSFCLRLLRRNAAAASLSPSFRVADPAEERLLLSAVTEELIDAIYAGECEEVEPQELATLSEHLTSPKSDEGLSAHLLALYESLEHEPDGVYGLAAAAARYRSEIGKPFSRTSFGAELFARSAEVLSSLSRAIEEEATVGAPEKLDARRAFAVAEAAYLREVAARLRAGDEEWLRGSLVRLESLPRTAARETPLLTDLHREASGEILDLIALLKVSSTEDISGLLTKTATLTESLYRILLLLRARLSAEKERRNMLGFLDIERRTLSLLSENGRPTELARKIASELDGVYLDEFQDVNALQYEIFRAISREDNLFMVGDVKQCIYAFRHSDPSIFADLRRRSPALSEGKDGPATLFFRENFRSDRPIVSYVNRLAGSLLLGLGGYSREEDDLVFGKPAPTSEEPVRTHIFALPTKKRGLTPEEAAEADARMEEASGREAAFVAAEVARLLREGRRNDGSPIRPSDILLLFRNTGKAARFAEALSRVAPVEVIEEGSLLRSPEVLLSLSLLYTVDNPRRDVHLAAALRSPVFGVTLSELVAIRAEQRTAPTLYDALLSYTEAHHDFEKGKRFLGLLAAWRDRAEGERVGDLLLAVFTDAGLLSLGGAGTSPRHDNLLRFYEYARSFAGAPYRGLSGFLSFIAGVTESEAVLKRPPAERRADAVRLLTVHASKGLEAPVVFLCDTAHPFNRRDTTAPILYDKAYGPALRLLREDGVLVDNPLYTLLSRRLREVETEEEARLLYVALTRARERLYVTGSCQKPEEKLEKAALAATLPDRHRLLREGNALSWIISILSATRDPYLTVHPLDEGLPTVGEEKGAPSKTPPPDGEKAAALAAELGSRILFTYPDAAATDLPEKLSVSRLSPAVLDGSEGEEGRTALGPFRPSVPRFLSGVRQDEGALRGTATHLFLQFADLDRLTPDGIEAELARLVEAEFLTREDAARVRTDEVATFSRSPLLARMRAAGRVRRELRFHALLPADRFAGEEKAEALLGRELLVQGVIDCVIEEEDGYTVVDYKTDRLSPEELADRRLAARVLTARHGEQLSYYAAASERLYGKPPKELLIYSLALGDTVEVCKENHTSKE